VSCHCRTLPSHEPVYTIDDDDEDDDDYDDVGASVGVCGRCVRKT
jgi:hypothetical protein